MSVITDYDKWIETLPEYWENSVGLFECWLAATEAAENRQIEQTMQDNKPNQPQPRTAKFYNFQQQDKTT